MQADGRGKEAARILVGRSWCCSKPTFLLIDYSSVLLPEDEWLYTYVHLCLVTPTNI